MKVTVCFDNVRVVVPCGDGSLRVRDLMHEATLRYRKATGRTESGPIITRLSSLSSQGLLDPDDTLHEVVDDNEQILAHFSSHQDNYLQQHINEDGASSMGTNSPDYYHQSDQHFIDIHSKLNSNMKRESVKRLSMHVLSTREQNLPTYSALSLPRESKRRESFVNDENKKGTTVFNYYKSKNSNDFNNDNSKIPNIQDIIIKNEPGPHGLNVVQCIDLSGNDQGLKVEGIEPNGRISKDGQIDLHDKIIKINGHNLLGIPFGQVQDILRLLTTEPCLKISIVKNQQQQQQQHKYKKKNDSSNSSSSISKGIILNDDKIDNNEDSIKKLQHSSNYNLLQNSNTRKIGRMIDIELIKRSNGLGFSVTTRDNPAGGHCPIYIKNIISQGAAVEDGRLRSGDRLLEVNNIQMTGKTQTEVVSFLRSIQVGSKVKIVVSRQEEVSSSSSLPPPTAAAASSSSVDIPEATPDIPIIIPDSPVNKKLLNSPTSKDANSSSGSSSNSRNNKKDDDVLLLSPRKHRILLTLDIPVHDSEKAGLGVSVKGKQSTVGDTTGMDLGIFIKSVINGGAASRDGRLRKDDQLLNVNGVSLLGLSNCDAMETLRRAMFNGNSPISGIITLTVARKVSTYDDTIELQKIDNKLQYYDKSSTFIPDNGRINDNHDGEEEEDREEEEEAEEKNNRDDKYNNPDVLDEGLLLSSSAGASPWNPVIDRLTEQYGKNSLRNESYCLATNKTWLDSMSSTKKKFTLGLDQDLLLEESSNSGGNNDNINNKKIIIDNNDDNNKFFSNETATTPTYDSQLSLEEFNSSNNKFSRDAVGRQSMSEKRHAALDAKNTDTYKRNKKLREGRNKDSVSIGGYSGNGDCNNDYDDNNDKKIIISNDNNSFGTKSNDNTTSSLSSSSLTSKRESSFEAARKKFEKNLNLNTESNYCGKNDYVYTIGNNCSSSSSSSNNNKILPPRKHWLVDDEHVRDGSATIDHRNHYHQQQHLQFKDNNGEGFSNSRGDVKQASLNSALDDRYKRTKKKGGIRSMLRLGKNRKSLNFGDNIEARHETSNYCSGTINYIA